jgi:hypothetical protein
MPPRPGPSADGPPAAPVSAATAVELRYAPTESSVALLQQMRAVLVATTHQANKTLVGPRR